MTGPEGTHVEVILNVTRDEINFTCWQEYAYKQALPFAHWTFPEHQITASLSCCESFPLSRSGGGRVDIVFSGSDLSVSDFPPRPWAQGRRHSEG